MGETETKGGQVVKFVAPKPRFMDRFRSHAPLERVPTLPPIEVRERPKALIGAPLTFFYDVCHLTDGRAALTVALLIYRRTCICQSRTVTLPEAELTAAGITRSEKQRALVRLAAAGIVRLEKVSTRRAAKVTLLWQAA